MWSARNDPAPVGPPLPAGFPATDSHQPASIGRHYPATNGIPELTSLESRLLALGNLPDPTGCEVGLHYRLVTKVRSVSREGENRVISDLHAEGQSAAADAAADSTGVEGLAGARASG